MAFSLAKIAKAVTGTIKKVVNNPITATVASFVPGATGALEIAKKLTAAMPSSTASTPAKSAPVTVAQAAKKESPTTVTTSTAKVGAKEYAATTQKMRSR